MALSESFLDDYGKDPGLENCIKHSTTTAVDRMQCIMMQSHNRSQCVEWPPLSLRGVTTSDVYFNHAFKEQVLPFCLKAEWNRYRPSSVSQGEADARTPESHRRPHSPTWVAIIQLLELSSASQETYYQEAGSEVEWVLEPGIPSSSQLLCQGLALTILWKTHYEYTAFTIGKIFF